jgi:hypothetical protein
MKSSTVSSAMAGLIHPGIAHIALQQNATASSMPGSGDLCAVQQKRKPARQGNIRKRL